MARENFVALVSLTHMGIYLAISTKRDLKIDKDGGIAPEHGAFIPEWYSIRNIVDSSRFICVGVSNCYYLGITDGSFMAAISNPYAIKL